MPAKPKPKRVFAVICGAKAKHSGKPCQKPPMPGRKRCRLHGGVTTIKGNTTAAKPGALYSKFLSEEERQRFDTMELGGVDNELKLLKVRLERYLKAEDAEIDGTLELESRTERDGGGPMTVPEERTYKKKDWRMLIERLSARIESMEKTRKELLEGGGGDEGEEPKPMSFVFEIVDGRKGE